MSYSTVHRSQDPALSNRILAAVEQEAWNNPTAHDTLYGEQVRQVWGNAYAMVWPVCIASDVEAAYASTIAGNNPNPGGDEAVVTDGMILANVQAKWPADPA